MIVCETEKCTGCMACMNICPLGAISPSLSSTYKTVPQVNAELCKGCGKCQSICPVNNPLDYNTPYNCYAATRSQTLDTKNCATAGVSAALGEYIVSRGGIVFGAGYKNGKVCHMGAENKEQLELLKGSKYVQSDIGFTYKETESHLESGRRVLFTGTPCQIAGLYSYLSKDYENLITADLVCHGVAPHRFLDDYLKELGLSHKARQVRFRGDEDYFFTVYGDDGILFKESAATNVYYRAYYNKILMRDNCYSCKYATYKNRPADITLGDFWGINRDKYMVKDGKVSIVLINTKKGEELFGEVGIPSVQTEISEGISGNAQLKYPCPEDEDRAKFLKNYNHGFTKAVMKTKVKKNINRNKLNLVIFRIKAEIKRGLKI